jgi:DNA-binding MarR family transcriptional regulator
MRALSNKMRWSSVVVMRGFGKRLLAFRSPCRELIVAPPIQHAPDRPGGPRLDRVEAAGPMRSGSVRAVWSEAPGRRIRSRDLARALRWDRRRISHQLARMEARGTVRRESCAEDGRSFNVVLTDAGLAAIHAAAPAHAAAVPHCFADILTPDQLNTLGDIAEAITTHLAADHNHPESGNEYPDSAAPTRTTRARSRTAR